MRFLTIGAIASTSATLLLTLNGWPVQAQGIVPAADGTGTQVTPNGPDHIITGGSTAADQQNLFHRFTDFNLLTGESATFLTQPEILNILSGVTGNNPSLIDGLLQVSGSNANLFLINPNGILLGPNSALNLQGSFTATTADQVNFADGLWDLTGASDYATLVGPPQSFGFTLENPASVMNAGNLAVAPGESVLLLGGQVLNTGTLTAPGGEVVISAVEGGNWVRIAPTGSLLNLELATIGELRVSEAYLNETFTPEILVAQRSEAAYPILHLATHGQFTSGELSNSYIQFWDQRLGLDELPQLQLGDPAVELMVLSACRTVLGDSEAELGFAGLAIKSGAKSAIAALWQVSDLETAGLMAELYTQVGQVTYKAAALQQAQLAMLRGDVVIQDDTLIWSGGSEPLPDTFSGRGFADTQHPYYWAAFTLVGNPW